ncbi:MAG: GLPGLI family protein [Chitinophagales bacterium]
MKRIFLTLNIMLLAAFAAKGQYTTVGKIEYERKVNIYAQMAEMEQSEWFEKIKAQIPKFNTSYFDLVFDTARSIYKPGREVEGNVFKMFGGGPATDNIVLTDFVAGKVKANKKVYEQRFYVEDSLRKMDWTVKDEIRTIANFKCHKAVGRMCDSVYVVAFYTEDIIVSGGPEMFGGLPGMILELAIPRLHTTWTATKIELIAPKETDFTIQEKGKKVNEKELYETVESSFKSWGKMAPRNIWWTVL